jgi:hypothetical protein
MLLQASAAHNSSRASKFADNHKAIARMRDDMRVIKDYFEGLAEGMPTLKRVMESEFDLFEAIIEILSIAAGLSDSDIQDFVLVLHKKVRNIAITKFVVGDLYHLVKPQEEYNINELMDSMHATMQAVAPTDEKAAKTATDRGTIPGLRVDQMMAQCIQENTRKRPLKKGSMEQAENDLNIWKGNVGEKKRFEAPAKRGALDRLKATVRQGLADYQTDGDVSGHDD